MFNGRKEIKTEKKAESVDEEEGSTWPWSISSRA
jgi:hypothetical protein